MVKQREKEEAEFLREFCKNKNLLEVYMLRVVKNAIVWRE